MEVMLPTVVSVQINDVDLLTILDNKLNELLQGADYAEKEESGEEYWLWKKKEGTVDDFEKWKEISEIEYELLDGLILTLYRMRKYVDAK